jgi:glycosyltransferase involved in cell wall biosynthesis
MKEKLISVVMPVYNSQEYIREAIESILNQTYRKFELIIVYDESQDKSLDIIEEYNQKDDRIILLKRKKGTLVTALNDGIKIAKGEYIARMDADDISYPNRFEKQVDYLNKHPNIFMLGTNYRTIYEDGITDKGRKKYEGADRRSKESIDNENCFLSINEAQKFIHPTIMIKKELFDIVGLYKQYILEDIELYFRTASYGLGIAKIEEELLDYRARDDSKSSTENRARQTREIIEMKVKYIINKLSDEINNAKYLIWGADISGIEAQKIINEIIPEAECVGYIDPFKEGCVNSIPIIQPEVIQKQNFNYVFICTQAGAKPAREKLSELGYIEIEDFFKIS